MPRWTKLLVIIGLLVIALGCEKKSGPEGKVADGKGQPVPNMSAPPVAHETTPGETRMKPSSGVIRFTASKEGIITDSETGLEWYSGPDRDITWNQAVSWVKDLSIAGGRWRMPTRSELGALYQQGVGDHNLDPVFKISGWFVWSGETVEPSSAWCFYFNTGIEHTYDRGYSNNERVLTVRSRK